MCVGTRLHACLLIRLVGKGVLLAALDLRLVLDISIRSRSSKSRALIVLARELLAVLDPAGKTSISGKALQERAKSALGLELSTTQVKMKFESPFC